MIGRVLASLVLPLTMAGVVPALLVRDPRLDPILAALGLPLIALGLALLGWTVSLFVRVGRGTLAPWDPTERIVVVGPYAHVRNPMISGVWSVLLGEAILFASREIAVWAGLFLVVNHLYFVLSEEPGLVRRFGESYEHYRRNVPRWIPRRRPWTG